MATSNNDRISSQRLLDTLKGLQASKHLGSEPEVVTETVEYPAVVSPAVGTYQTVEELYATMGQKPDENRFPIKVYTTAAVPADGTFPFTVNEPSGEYVEITKKVTVDDMPIYGQADFPDDGDTSSYTGYFISQRRGDSGVIWQAVRLVNGSGNFDPYPWEMSAYTKTTTTKTKHTIKQDYLPNADWNVNDPDADGYVQGRTHWVEQSLTGIIPSAGTYNSFTEIQDAWNSVEPSVVYVCDECNVTDFPVTMPEYTGEPVAVLDKEFNLEGIRVLGPSDWDGTYDNGMPEYLFIFKHEQLPSFQQNVVMSSQTHKYYRWKAIAEVAHKLDRKFYDYTEPFDPTGYTKDSDISIQTISKDYESSQGPFSHSYNFVKLPNGQAYGNITLHVDSWDDTTKTGTFSTIGTPLANPGSMVGGTAYVNGGIVFFTVEADGSNPRIANPIPSDLLVTNRAYMWIPQMFIKKEDE